MTTLEQAAALARSEHGLVIVATLRGDETIPSSLANAGIVPHPAAAPLLSVGVTRHRVPTGGRDSGDALVPVPLVGSRGCGAFGDDEGGDEEPVGEEPGCPPECRCVAVDCRILGRLLLAARGLGLSYAAVLDGSHPGRGKPPACRVDPAVI